MSACDKEKQERAVKANALIKTIGNHGRRFFYNEERDAYAYLKIDDRGRVWHIDEWARKAIYTHYSGPWRHFSHGGTMKTLVIGLRRYIVSGVPLPGGIFGPWSKAYYKGDLWGYGQDMEKVRRRALDLGIIRSAEQHANNEEEAAGHATI